MGSPQVYVWDASLLISLWLVSQISLDNIQNNYLKRHNFHLLATLQEEVMAELKYSYPHMFEGSLNSTDPDYNEKILTNNFLKVVVFYEDLNHEVVSEFRGYTVSRAESRFSPIYVGSEWGIKAMHFME